MKQGLVRAQIDVLRRLAARASRDGRSVTAVATEIYEVAVDIAEGDRRARLRSRAAATGVIRNVSVASLSPAERRRIVDSAEGIGPVVDEILAEERGRR